ncbi:hypothetical protein E8E12_000673 [Didymella heteroderae]|uniref:Uncharacterized protein n=1 Tax=Didymella heteroderae TaxID=1769908 RepID=A0A9P5BUW3_9PLEO|nr:hypothetical protein E8E12_000673 [Didymella heteroderae]
MDSDGTFEERPRRDNPQAEIIHHRDQGVVRRSLAETAASLPEQPEPEGDDRADYTSGALQSPHCSLSGLWTTICNDVIIPDADEVEDSNTVHAVMAILREQVCEIDGLADEMSRSMGANAAQSRSDF